MIKNTRSFFRPFLDQVRKFNKIPFIEKFLVKRTQGKDLSNFWVKLTPGVHLYSPGSIRQVKRNNINYELDISDYLQHVVYFGLDVEPKKLLYNSIRNGMYVFDIGTNMGETLLNFAKINTDGRNFGFEPVPFLYEKAKKNISLNLFSNIDLHNIALSNIKEKLFFEVPKNRNSGSISMSSVKTNLSKEVQAFTFDYFISSNNISKVDFIKIDVEGFEVNVLEGADLTIRQFMPVLFIEVNDSHLRKCNTDASTLVKKVSSYGYKIIDSESGKVITNDTNFEGRHLDILCTSDKYRI